MGEAMCGFVEGAMVMRCGRFGSEENGMQLRTWVWSREFMCAVWRTCVEKWRDGERSWEGGVVLLGVPFTYAFFYLFLHGYETDNKLIQ